MLQYSQQSLSIDFYRDALNTLPLAMSCWTQEGQPFFYNDAFLQFFAVENVENFTQHMCHVSPSLQADGESSSTLAAMYLQQAFQQGSCVFTWLHQDKNKNNFFVKYTLQCLQYEGQKLVLVQFEDFRNKNDSAQPTLQSQEYFKAIVEAAPLSINIWSKTNELLACNQASLDLYDFCNFDDFKENVFKIYPPTQPNGKDSMEYSLELLEQTFKDGHLQTEWEFITLTGKTLYTDVILTRVEVAGQTVVVEYTRDVGELKSSRDLARKADERMKIMFDSMPLCATLWNKDFQIVDCNLAAPNLFALQSKEEFLEKFILLSPEFQPNGRSTLENVVERMTAVFTEGFGRFEWMHQDLDGEPIPTEITLIRVEFQNEYYILGYIRDLREHKAMLQELEAHEQELRTAKELAEQSTKTKGEFLANMSHEIRTPMNGILGLLHLLQQTSMTDMQKDYVHKTIFSANNLMRIINDILDFSKIEAGKLLIEAHPFTLESICQDVLDLYGPTSKEKGLTLHVHGGEHAQASLLGDALRLKQVLFNLVSNAIKFTRCGSVFLEIESTVLKEKELHCQFAIRDTGIGLSQKQISRLFTAFSQADSSVTRKYGGTGLGLVISQSIIHMMQGKIWVESQVEKGSTFYCTAVFALDSQGHMAAEDEKSSLCSNYENLELGHILLVEDNEINQIVAEEILKHVGYTLDIAENGIEALEKLTQNSYDAVLMDIQMPLMDGYTATQKIRAQEKYADLAIIAMSAHAMKGDKEISLSHGMNEHITKPIDADILYKTLHHWICIKRKAEKN